jgi:hypothetical protein
VSNNKNTPQKKNWNEELLSKPAYSFFHRDFLLGKEIIFYFHNAAKLSSMVCLYLPSLLFEVSKRSKGIPVTGRGGP